MTNEQIEKLLFNAGGLNEFPKLERLLEERKRLLKALRGALAANTAPFAEQRIREAIAFAEEAAR